MTAIAWQQTLFGDAVALCCICGRTLTNLMSVQLGYGPVCRSHRKGDRDVEEGKFGTIVADDLPRANVDGVLQYQPWSGNQSYCRLRIYRRTAMTVVVLTEQPGNSGMSVTNWAEHLATMVWKTYGLNPAQTTWVEHYPNAYYRHYEERLHSRVRKATQEEQFDLITFRWDADGAHNPQWKLLMHIDEDGEVTGPPSVDPVLSGTGLATVDGLPFSDWNAWLPVPA